MPRQNVFCRFPSRDAFVSAVLKRIQESFDASFAIKIASQATNGDFYIYGGTLRRVLLDDPRDGDLDLVVKDGDHRIYNAYKQLGLDFSRNSNNHHRYRWNKLQIDICSPSEFFAGYSDVGNMLSAVDLKINSLALHVGSRAIIDPFGLVTSDSLPDIGINWSLWDPVRGDQLSLLLVRLIRIMYEFPDLILSVNDRRKLQSTILPLLRQASWDHMIDRFPAGKEAFLGTIRQIIEMRDIPDEPKEKIRYGT